MKQYILDTNSILRLLIKDVPSQSKKVEKLIQDASRSKLTITIPEIVVFEIAFTLEKYYEYKKEQIIFAIKSILSTSYLEVENRSLFLNALSIHEHKSIELVDSFLLVKSIDSKKELFTFDKKLNKLYDNLNK